MHNFISELQNIENSFYKLTRDFGVEVNKHNNYLDSLRFDQPDIVRYVRDQVAAGYSITNACIMAAKKFDLAIRTIRDLYDCDKYGRETQTQYAKKYLIHKLKGKGFKIADIACILDCNKQTIYNYLKKDFIP